MALPTIAVIGFAANVLTWYSALHSSLEMIYGDIQSLKSLNKDLKHQIKEVDEFCKGLEKWKSKWFFWKEMNMPEEMFIEFWTLDGYKRIIEKLQFMDSKIKRLKKKFKRFYALQGSEGGPKSLTKMQKAFLALEFHYLKADFLRKEMEIARKTLDDIHRLSKQGWNESRCLNTDDSIEEVYRIGTGFLLMRFAMNMGRDAEMLYVFCSQGRNFKAFLELDLFHYCTKTGPNGSLISPRTLEARKLHAAKIAKSWQREHMEWGLLVDDTSEKDSAPREVLASFPIRHDDNVGSQNMGDDAFQKAIQDLQAPTTSRIPEPAPGAWLEIRLSGKASTSVQKPLTSLRGIFSGNSGDQLSLSQYRAAYDLSQAMFLLLSTPWTNGLCCCAVRCSLHNDQNYHFAIVAGEDTYQQDHHWCRNQNEMLNRPLRRLGLALLEIICGWDIISAETDENGSITPVEFRPLQDAAADSGQPRQIGLTGMDEELRRVLPTYHLKLYSALKYCLTASDDSRLYHHDNANMRRFLSKLQLKVVAVFKYLYDAAFDSVIIENREEDLLNDHV